MRIQIVFLAAMFAASCFGVEDCSQPVGPGTPRRNTFATLFRFAPNFAFKSVDGAARYRFTVTGPATNSFEAASPEAALTPIWNTLPSAPGYALRCEALDAAGRVLAVAGERAFTKTAPFTGNYPPAVRPYREAALAIYRYMTALPAMKTLLETGEIEPTYQHNAYVSKTHAAHIHAMLKWAKVDPANKDRAHAFARASAEYLLSELEPTNAPLAYWPPTYTRKPLAYDPKKHGPANRPAMSGNDPHGAAKYRGEVMTVYPANVAVAFLRYSQLTGEKKYLDAAVGIGETYLKLRRPDGTWSLKYRLATGEPIGSNILVPTCALGMFEALAEATGDKRWRDAAESCFAWMEKGPLTDWNWDGQFEDINPQPPYMDPTKHNAIECMFQLLKRKGDDPAARAKARELLRWSEDQFVFWEKPANGPIPAPGEAMTRKGTFNPSRWHYPSVYEQYSCYISIDASAAKLIRAYLAMYRAEGKEEDLAKAKALADAITRVQEPSGRVPTFWAGKGDWIGEVRYDWLNCMAAAADALLQVAEAEENAQLFSKLRLTKMATRTGNRLVVDIPAGTNRTANGSIPLDLSRFDGKGVRGTIRVRGWGLTPAPESWLGFKFMMPYRNAKTDTMVYHGAPAMIGDFGWRMVTLNDSDQMAVRTKASLTLGIQDATGKVEFDLSSFRLEETPRLWPITNQTLRCAYTDRVRNLPVHRGVMLGHGLKEKDFADLEAWGVTLARFQMSRQWSVVGGNRDLADYDRYIDRCLDDLENHLVWAKKHGIKIVVDLHAAPGSRDEHKDEYMFHNAIYAEHFIQTWRRIATRFRGRPDIFGFDLVNEPQQTSEAAPGCDYWTLQYRAARAIREIDSETPVIIESNMYDPPDTFSYLMPMDLTNIIYQSHMYVPGDYTHQGVHNRNGRTIPYPNAKAGYNAAFLRKALQPVRDFQLRHGARIYVGEFSAIIWAPGAGDYIRDCIDVFEDYGWDWTFHAFREWKGWSVEHEATPETRNPVPSADNPRKRALLDGFRRGRADTGTRHATPHTARLHTSTLAH